VALAELRAGAAGIHTTAFTSVTNSGGCRAQQCRAAEAPLLEHPVDVRTGIWALAAVRAVWAGGNRSERRVAAAAAEAPRASAGLHTSATRAMAQPLSGEGGLQPPPEWAEGTAVDPSNVVPEYSTVDWRRKIGPPLATLKQRVANKVGYAFSRQHGRAGRKHLPEWGWWTWDKSSVMGDCRSMAAPVMTRGRSGSSAHA
jgi:hypothetical protein